ncbi:MAG: permease-like cell division protein FtsX [Bacteroidales bacterium]|nr:permease-like cell division protein FtsX [Bacteroidales bacterium]
MRFKINKRIISSYLTTTVSITLLLLLLSIILTLYFSTSEISKYVKENISFNVFVNPNSKEIEIFKLQKALDAMPFVKSTRYITKDVAAEELKKELGDTFLELLDENPLPPSIEVKYKSEYANKDSIAKIEKYLKNFPVVEDVYYQKDLLYLIYKNIQKISFIIMFFSLLMLLIAIALINNTIRLLIYSKRYLIRTMQLIGASKSFILFPFIKAVLVISSLASIITMILYKIIFSVLSSNIKELNEFITHETQLSIFFILLILSAIIGVISSYLSVTRYLRMNVNELY